MCNLYTITHHCSHHEPIYGIMTTLKMNTANQ